MLSNALTRRSTTSPSLFFGSRDPFFELADRFFGGMAPRFFDTENATGAWMPAVDICETESEFSAIAELPGMTKDDIEVSVEDNVLTISGERKLEKETEKDTFHRVERSYGTFTRAFSLPSHVDATKVKASFKDGVLTVTMPKTEKSKGRKVKVA